HIQHLLHFTTLNNMASETTSLLPSNASGPGSSYYFLKSQADNSGAESGDQQPVLEQFPSGTTPNEFMARPVGNNTAASVSFMKLVG
ncbi:MAG: hypothetical protein AAGJ35_15680, partial [Myxococcota bacterium]